MAFARGWFHPCRLHEWMRNRTVADQCNEAHSLLSAPRDLSVKYVPSCWPPHFAVRAGRGLLLARHLAFSASRGLLRVPLRLPGAGRRFDSALNTLRPLPFADCSAPCNLRSRCASDCSVLNAESFAPLADCSAFDAGAPRLLRIAPPSAFRTSPPPSKRSAQIALIGLPLVRLLDAP